MRNAAIAFLMLASIVGSGCQAMYGDFDKYGKNYDTIPLEQLEIGATKTSVREVLGRPVNVIGAKQFDDCLIEVWAYERWHSQFGNDRLEEEYWLYFVDGELEQWGRPGDWAATADKIYEVRMR